MSTRIFKTNPRAWGLHRQLVIRTPYMRVAASLPKGYFARPVLAGGVLTDVMILGRVAVIEVKSGHFRPALQRLAVVATLDGEMGRSSNTGVRSTPYEVIGANVAVDAPWMTCSGWRMFRSL